MKKMMLTNLVALLVLSLNAQAQQVAAGAGAQAPAAAAPAAAPVGDTGSLLVQGQAGPSQLFAQVKVQKCDSAARGRCSAPVYFNLNAAKVLPVGKYVVGFENSINPGWVTIQKDQTVTLTLARIDMPAGTNAQSMVRVFRDFSSPVEMKKVLFTQFYVGRPFFQLGAYGFGDLYLASSVQTPVTGRLSYDACATMGTSNPDGKPEIQAVIDLCTQWRNATTPQQLSPFFNALGFDWDAHVLTLSDRDNRVKVDNRGILEQTWIQGLRSKVVVRLGRHLVSAPMHGSDFVSVFPGVYRIMVEGTSVRSANATTQVSAGTVVETY